jgi:hypothetical protein
MRLSSKTRTELYKAIAEPIIDVRIKLKLPDNADFEVAQVEHKIWRRVKEALKLPNAI